MNETDICRNKHQDTPESVAAFEGITDSLKHRREEVRQAIEEAGEAGATVHEVARQMETHPNNISGRFTELKRDGLIEQTGRRPTPSGAKAGVYRLKHPPALTQADFGFDMFNEIYNGNPYA